MTTALVSLLMNVPVKPDIGMTGEITLRGQVLPVGGIKEKMLAAHRAGLKTIFLPKDNEGDLSDLPDEIRTTMKFIPVDHISQILTKVLETEKSNRG